MLCYRVAVKSECYTCCGSHATFAIRARAKSAATTKPGAVVAAGHSTAWDPDGKQSRKR